jgi:hypothetical protein
VQGGKPPELLELLLLEEEDVPPGSGSGHAPIDTEPVQLALPVAQSSLQRCLTLSTWKPWPPEDGMTRLSWLPSGSGETMACSLQLVQLPVGGNSGETELNRSPFT